MGNVIDAIELGGGMGRYEKVGKGVEECPISEDGERVFYDMVHVSSEQVVIPPMPRKRYMHGSYTQRRIKALSERGKRMAAARWKLDRARRDEEMPERIRELAEIEAINLPRKQGDALGCLQWTDFRSGKVRRWIVRIGDRVDRVTLESPGGKPTRSHGWTWVMDRLRGYLAGRK